VLIHVRCVVSEQVFQ